MAVLLVLGAVGAYFVSLEPASEAYDQSLVDVGIALGERIRASGEAVQFDLPGAVLRRRAHLPGSTGFGPALSRTHFRFTVLAVKLTFPSFMARRNVTSPPPCCCNFATCRSTSVAKSLYGTAG